MVSLCMQPAHQDKMNELFRIMEQLNPRSSLKSTLMAAQKATSKAKKKDGDYEHNPVTILSKSKE